MIRTAQLKDVSGINAIRKQVHALHANAESEIFRDDFCSELEDYIYEFLDAKEKTCLVDEQDGKIVGYAMLEFVEKEGNSYNKARRYLRITEIGVTKPNQNNGIGQDLLNAVKELAAQKSFEQIELDMWEFNGDALRFYEKQGFETYRRYMRIKI